MTSFVRAATVAVAAIGLSTPALAQDARAAATAVVNLTNPPARAQAQLDAQLKAMRNGDAVRAMLGQNPRFKQEAAKNQPAFNAALARIGAMQADAVGPIQREMMTASRAALIDGYAANFTVAELNAIAAFYKSPAGAKLLARQPAIGMEVNRQMQAKFGPRIVAAEKAVGPKIEAELKKLFPPQAPAK